MKIRKGEQIMTKKEMAYEILSETTYFGISQRKADARINRTSKERIEEVYKVFLTDREHANFYWNVM